MRLLRRGLFMPDMWGGRGPVYCPCPFSKPGRGRATRLQPEGKPEGEETREDQDAEDPPSSHGDQDPSPCDALGAGPWEVTVACDFDAGQCCLDQMARCLAAPGPVC